MSRLIDRFARELRGELEYRVYHSGALIEHVRGENLVVDGAEAVIARLLGGDVAAVITQLGVGTGGGAAAAADTALTDQVLVAIGDVTHPWAGAVTFDWTVGRGDANGLAIQEFGLFTTDGVLVARKTREGVIDKTGLISLEGSWTLSF